ncbi:MAG TPA: hypothetical protein VK171_03705 [Fimbriimonas sp.]|nr:hypothetical protein [Fimbriimonas sp.]
MIKLKTWQLAIVGVAVIGGLMYFSDRPVTVEGGEALIRNRTEYEKVSQDATTMVLSIFAKVDQGQEATPEELETVKRALSKFRALQTYEPRQVMSFYGGARCYQILGEKQRASEQYEQAVLNLSTDAARDNQGVRLTAYEAMAQLASICLELGAEKLADANSLGQAGDKAGSEESTRVANLIYNKALRHSQSAVEAVPQAYKYWLIHGNVLLAVGKKAEARAAIIQAKKIAPDDAEVKVMAKMVGA